jgi:Immunity protein 50
VAEAQSNAICEVGGAEALVEWFGNWPNFHDAEVLSIAVNQTGTSCVRVHTWEMTPEVDAKGFHVLRKHVVVSFFLDGLKDEQLDGFIFPNILFELTVTKTSEGLRLLMDSVYGIEGILTAKAIRVEIEPGMPVDGQER